MVECQRISGGESVVGSRIVARMLLDGWRRMQQAEE